MNTKPIRDASIALLTLPDGRVVFQRRDQATAISPGQLGFFGGHVEPGETFGQAIIRELGEETSLDPAVLQIKHMRDFVLYVPARDEHVSYHLYRGYVPDMNFQVFEGDRAEAYTRAEALARTDVTISGRHALTNILGA